MFTKLNKANGYYAGKSYGSFQTTTTGTDSKTTTTGSILNQIKTTLTGGGTTARLPLTGGNTTTETEDKSVTKTLAENKTVKWVIVIAVVAVGAYLIYKHCKH